MYLQIDMLLVYQYLIVAAFPVLLVLFVTFTNFKFSKDVRLFLKNPDSSAFAWSMLIALAVPIVNIGILLLILATLLIGISKSISRYIDKISYWDKDERKTLVVPPYTDYRTVDTYPELFAPTLMKSLGEVFYVSDREIFVQYDPDSEERFIKLPSN